MIRLSINRPNLPTVTSRYEFTHRDGSKKFWEIEIMNMRTEDRGRLTRDVIRHFRVRYGKVGKGGTFSDWKMCSDFELQKLVYSKTFKGYRYVQAISSAIQGSLATTSQVTSATEPVKPVKKKKEPYSEFYLLEEFDYDCKER
jgi:predicted DNA-binding WGR domain protein